MKKIKFDQKQAKLKIENKDDLWYLSQLIDPGDFIKGKTIRKIKIGKDTDRKQNITKKPVFLKIQVEKLEQTNDSLRALGIITEGPDDIQKGEHHTFNLEQNTTFILEKPNWLSYQLERLKEATTEKKSRVLIVVLDRSEASFALLKTYGYELLSEMKGKVQKKDEEQKKESTFYKDILEKITDYIKRYDIIKIIVASPAFFKEDLLKQANEEIKEKTIFATCNSTGKNGINEVLRRPEVKAALAQDRIAKEIGLVENLLVEISKDNLAAYGLKPTDDAANAGAIAHLLLTDNFIQQQRQKDYKKIDNIMKLTDKMKGHITIISSDHDGGKKLDGLGGIAAILRYKLSHN
jgi:protein pelota